MSVESPVRGDTHAGFGERPWETGREQSRYRAQGRLIWLGRTGRCRRPRRAVAEVRVVPGDGLFRAPWGVYRASEVLRKADGCARPTAATAWAAGIGGGRGGWARTVRRSRR